MITTFKKVIDLIGLSQKEASILLDTRLDTVKSWSSGRNPTPQGVLDEITSLARKMRIAADETCELIESQRESCDGVDLNLSHEWPFESVRERVWAMVFVEFPGLM